MLLTFKKSLVPEEMFWFGQDNSELRLIKQNSYFITRNPSKTLMMNDVEVYVKSFVVCIYINQWKKKRFFSFYLSVFVFFCFLYKTKYPFYENQLPKDTLKYNLEYTNTNATFAQIERKDKTS